MLAAERQKPMLLPGQSPTTSQMPRGRRVRWTCGRLEGVRRAVWTADAWRLMIPAFLYTAQSILGFMALNTMDPASYQCFSQVRLLFTTCLSVLVTKREVAVLQWVSLCVMTAGLVGVHLGKKERVRSFKGEPRTTVSPSASSDNDFDILRMHLIQWQGVLYVLSSCLATSYASVYLEWVMTSLRSVSVAARNVQLSVFGITFAILSLYFVDIRPNWREQEKAVAQHRCYAPVHYNIFTRPRKRRSGFFYHGVASHCVKPYYVWERFDTWTTWGVIVLQGLGGLLIGFTMSIADSVMKCLATAVSTVISAGIAYGRNDFDYSWVSLLGGIFTLLSSYIFNIVERERKMRGKAT